MDIIDTDEYKKNPSLCTTTEERQDTTYVITISGVSEQAVKHWNTATDGVEDWEAWVLAL